MISAKGITKRFGSLLAVDQVGFEVGTGEVIGFIGPNGAGKTTTMRILTGYLPASEGSATVAGYDVFDDPMAVRRAVGYLPETPPLYKELTVGAYLHFVAEIREVPRAEASRRVGKVMEQVGLSGWEDRILGSLSKGYRQRVGLAQAVIHDPKVLILDEPTSGLDPGQVAGIRTFIQNLASDRTVILSTHILAEVERLCPRVIMIAKGKIVANGSLDEVRQRAGEGVRYRVELSAPDVAPESVATAVGDLPDVTRVRPAGEVSGFRVLEVKADADPRTHIAALATARGWGVRAMEKLVPSLEEAFLTITGTER
jgi:ABC-2 type transport system ATP-binding protein